MSKASKAYEELLVRLDAYIKHKGISWNKFGNQSGFASGAVWRIMKEKKVFGVDKLLRIFETFPDLHSGFLLFGDGPMMKEGTYSKTDIPRLENGEENLDFVDTPTLKERYLAMKEQVKTLKEENQHLQIKNKAYLEAMQALNSPKEKPESSVAGTSGEQ